MFIFTMIRLINICSNYYFKKKFTWAFFLNSAIVVIDLFADLDIELIQNKLFSIVIKTKNENLKKPFSLSIICLH